MPRIKFEEYAQNVELCRQRLIDITNSSPDVSFAELTTICSQQINSPKKSLHEVRFFDINGVLLKTQ